MPGSTFRGSWIWTLVVMVLVPVGAANAAGWRAGTSKVAITPRKPMWMAGYGARDKPSEGAEHDLWAKALVLEDPAQEKLVIVTLDLCGIDRGTSRNIRDAIRQEHGIGDERIVIGCSHTHCGPVVGENLYTMYRIDEEQKELIRDYTSVLESEVKTAVHTALERLAPVEIAWDTGRADFAVNRRENVEAQVPDLRTKNSLKGPTDHDVPVLRVKGEDGKVKAIVFGYACHCTVLSYYKFCGDYAGFTQIELEKVYPGSQAMFVAGCGADQNPLPRRTVELASSYGYQLASAVARVVESPMRPVAEGMKVAYEEIPLKLAELPSRSQVLADTRSDNFYVANRARKLLALYERDGRLSPVYPYPVQIFKLGELTWVTLGGEVVVDYSLRLKRNLGSSHTWVSGYCNDVMAYIPSLRVLKEGGYEGATSMLYYGLPTTWSEDVENQIVDAVTRLNDTLRAVK